MVKSKFLQASTFSKPIVFPFLNLGLAEKPVSFSSSLSYSKQFLNNFQTQRADKTKVLTTFDYPLV
jgi:outer membrane protein insertion porin family